jgi:hypothetical protein
MRTKNNATSTCRFITTNFLIFFKTLNEVMEEKSFEVWVFFLVPLERKVDLMVQIGKQ